MCFDIFWQKLHKPVDTKIVLRTVNYLMFEAAVALSTTGAWFLVHFSTCSSDFSRFCSRDSVHSFRRKCSFNRLIFVESNPLSRARGWESWQMRSGTAGSRPASRNSKSSPILLLFLFFIPT
jgi:hypothetical protein